MKRIIFRILAFAVDMILINLLISVIGLLPVFNNHRETANDIYKEASSIQESYKLLDEVLDKYLEDNIISVEEVNEIKEDYPDYKDVISASSEKELSEDDAKELKNKCIEIASNKINDLSYRLTKNDGVTTFLGVGIYVLYFGVLQYLLKGQTLGKKLFKLKVFNNNDPTISVPLWSYLTRSLLMSMGIVSIITLVLITVLNKDTYLNILNPINTVTYIYEMAFLLVFMLRSDSRSVHDLLLGTRVSRIDSNGNEIIESISKTDEEEVKELKSTPKKKANKNEKNSDKTN